MHFLAIYHYYSVTHLFRFITNLWVVCFAGIWLIEYFECIVLEFSVYFKNESLVRPIVGNIFLHSVDCLYSQLTVFFAILKHFNFMKPICWLLVLLLHNWNCIEKLSRMYPECIRILSSRNFRVWSLMLRFDQFGIDSFSH